MAPAYPNQENSARDLYALQQERFADKLRVELGPQIMRFFSEEVEDVTRNADGILRVKRSGGSFEPFGEMNSVQALQIIGTVAAMRGLVVTGEHPILETDMPIGGARFEGIVPPVSREPVFAIRFRPRQIYSLADYVATEMVTEQQAAIACSAIAQRRNIIVAGGPGSGKTTLLNALLLELRAMCRDDRVVTIEDTLELQCSMPDSVALQATGNTTMLDCLAATMRLNAQRILVGEVRGGEAYTLLKAWNTGHPGGMATVHANSAANALTRLEHLVAEATIAPSRELIGETVDLVIYISAENGLRKVTEMVRVRGFADGQCVIESEGN